MPILREFSAWIVSEGQSLREYLVSYDTHTNKVSCWVPCEAGKSFSVHWRDEGSQVYTCSFIYLDGFVVPGRFLYGCGEACRDGVRTGPRSERPFIFVEQLSIVDSGENISRDVGTIKLKIRRISMDGSRPANEIQQLPKPSGSQNNKLSHYVGYGKERRTYEQYPRTWNVKSYKDSGNRSYATFVFRYRSREFLLSQGILPEDSALQIPPAVRENGPISHSVASGPLLVGSSPNVTTDSHREIYPEQMVLTARTNVDLSEGPFRTDYTW